MNGNDNSFRLKPMIVYTFEIAELRLKVALSKYSRGCLFQEILLSAAG
jgi:hypothetical protein